MRLFFALGIVSLLVMQNGDKALAQDAVAGNWYNQYSETRYITIFRSALGGWGARLAETKGTTADGSPAEQRLVDFSATDTAVSFKVVVDVGQPGKGFTEGFVTQAYDLRLSGDGKFLVGSWRRSVRGHGEVQSGEIAFERR